MKQLLVTKTTEYGDAGGTPPDVTMPTINSLVEGAIALFDENNQLIQSTGIAANPTTNLLAYVGRAAMPDKAVLVDRASFRWAKQAYKTARPKVVSIGADIPASPNGNLNLPPNLVEGMVFSVKVTYTDDVMHRDPYSERYDAIASRSDTFDSVLTRLVNGLNKKLDGITVTTVIDTASSNISGLIFTGSDGVGFSVLPQETLEYSDVIGHLTKNGSDCPACTTFAPLDRGFNTDAQCRELETMCLADVGRLDTATDGQQIWKEPSRIEAGANYTRYVLNWINPRNDVPSEKTTYEQTLYILVPEAASNLITELDAIFGAF
jgi:hypothetical protein